MTVGEGRAALLRKQVCIAEFYVDFSATAALHDRFSPLESVAVSMLMTKAMTLKTTGFGGAVSGVREV